MAAPDGVPGRRPTVGAALLVCALVTATAALPTLDRYGAYVVALVGTQVLAALSLNVLMGYAGQISLGQAALVGVGAFGAAQLAEWLPFPLPLLVAPVVAAAFATVVGLPSLRIRGLQVAATTLAFGVAAAALLFARPWAAMSSTGLAATRPRFLDDDHRYAILVLAVVAVVLVVDTILRRSRMGRAFLAVRDREDTAAAWGVHVGRTKLIAYAVSGAYAGVAGGLYAYLLERVTADSFSVWASLALVAAAVVGGRGSVAGVTTAQSVFVALPEMLRPLARWSPLVSALLLTLMPVLRPEGLGWFLDRPLPTVRRRRAERPDAQQPDAEHQRVGRPPLRAPRRALQLAVPRRTLLAVHDLRISFGGLQVLTGVDLEVPRHSVVGLIGPNGAGKSTVFNCLSGLAEPDAGHVTYRGLDLLALPAADRASLGIARTFQQVGLCGPQTVFENMLIAQHALAGGRYREPRRALTERARDALELLGLDGALGSPVADLPHGEQRLVEVAAALSTVPELVLLDEPAAGLDPEEAMVLTDRLLTLRRRLGLTVVIVEHHLPVISRLCDHVYVLDEGRVLASGPPSVVQQDPQVVQTYLGTTGELAHVG